MSTNTTQRKLDSKAFLAILNSRKTVKPTHAGMQVLLAVQGNGQFLPKGHKYSVGGEERENEFDRTIYNAKANSAMSMTRADLRTLLADAFKAESAGDTDKASELFNAYLNGVQMSFSVIEPSTRKFASGDAITAMIAVVETKAGEQQIVLNDVRYKAPTTVEDTKFEISDLITL